MTEAPEQQSRRERLQALLDHQEFAGNKTALGRALGYQNGAFVRQMLAGERPISEKTVAYIDSMQAGKFRGWFARPGELKAAAEEAWPLAPFIPKEQWDRLDAAERSAVAWEASKALKAIQEAAGQIPASSGKRHAPAA